MSQERNIFEKRKHERKPVSIPARYRCLDDMNFSSGTIRNVSEKGLLLEGEKFESREHRLQVLAIDSQDEEIFQATAEVAWSKEARELKADDVMNAFLMGLQVIQKTKI